MVCSGLSYSTSACHAAGRRSLPGPGALLLCKNLALNIRDCLSLCLSEKTLVKAVGPFNLVSMPGEVKYPTSLHWKCATCRGLHIVGRYLNACRPHNGPSCSPHSSLLKRVRLMRAANQMLQFVIYVAV